MPSRADADDAPDDEDLVVDGKPLSEWRREYRRKLDAIAEQKRRLEAERQRAAFERQETRRKAADQEYMAAIDAAPSLLDALASGVPGVRLRAAKLLGEQGEETAVPALIAALGDEDGDVRCAAARALGKFPGSAPAAAAVLDAVATGRLLPFTAVPALKAMVPACYELLLERGEAPHSGFQSTVAEVIRATRDQHAPALLALMRTRPPVRAAAAKALSGMGVKGIPLLASVLTHADPQVRWHACAGLRLVPREQGHHGPNLLERFHVDADPQVRLAAALAAAHQLGPDALITQPALTGLLETGSPDQRDQAALALGEIGGAWCQPALEYLRAAWRRRLPHRELGRWFAGFAEDARKRVVSWLAAQLVDESRLRCRALETLEVMGPCASAALPTMAMFIDGVQPYIARAMMKTLANLHAPGNAALTLLLALYRSRSQRRDDPEWHLAMARALDRMRQLDSSFGLPPYRSAPMRPLTCLEPALPLVVPMLDAEHLGFRRAALRAIEMMGEGASNALPQVVMLLDKGACIYPALRALGAMGSRANDAIPKLLILLRSSRRRLAAAAARALSRVGSQDERVARALAERVRDGPARTAAVRALLRVQAHVPGTREVLESALRDAREGRFRTCCERVLRRLGPNTTA